MSNLIPFAVACAQVGDGRTSGYAHRGDLLPEPILVGNRSMLPQVEVDSLRLARIAGFTKAEQRHLVEQLMAARQRLATDAEVEAILRTMQAERLAKGDAGSAQAEKAQRAAAARQRVARRFVKATAA